MFEFSFINDLLLAIHRATGVDLVTLRYTFRILIVVMVLPVFISIVLKSVKRVQKLICRIFPKRSSGQD